MAELDTLVKILTILTLILGLFTVAAPVFLFFWARKYFAEAKDTVSPMHMEERLRSYTQDRDKIIKDLSFNIREDSQNLVLRLEKAQNAYHEDMKRHFEDVKEGIRGAFRESREAKEQATLATHRAELAETKLTGMEAVIGARLKHIEDICENRFPPKRRDS